jgi:hypothetical protein
MLGILMRYPMSRNLSHISLSVLSVVVTLLIGPTVFAQNVENSNVAPFDAKTPAARIRESHQDLTKKSGAKASTSRRKTEGDATDPNRDITPEEHEAIPYRPCLNARGWKNGRLICANQGTESSSRDSGREADELDPRR